MAFGRFTEWVGETVGSVFENEDENKKVLSDATSNDNGDKETKNNDRRTTKDNEEDNGPGLWGTLMQILPDFVKSEDETKKDEVSKTMPNGHPIRIELDECDSGTEASDSGAYTSMSEGTRADDLSLAEQGGKHGSGSESIASSERLGGYEGDTQNIVGEPADEGLIAGVGDDILYPEEALLDPSQRDPVSICGEMDVVFQYSGEARRMNVTIVQAYNLPTKEQGGSSSYRVRLLLYPTKRQRAKTRIREGSDPQYKELFRFTRLYPHELVSMVLRLRLYGSERMRRERLIGEGRVKFSSLNTATQQMVRVKLESKSEIATGGSGSPYSSSSDLSHSESNSSLPTLQGGHGNIPELLVGLSYNATTGRLGVEIIKGSHFKHLSGGRAPDSYVKVALMSSSGFEMTKSKTSVRRGQPHPTFKETFIFQVAQFQLADVTLLFTVFNKKGMKRKDTIGWFSMGLSNSSEEELAHWNEMRESRGQQVSRWHALIDS
ncbi:synaptotagmin-16-like isoform X5 [Amphiura filiformis]|uniref:synaptotagmin-16-like isoform X5 n=1 Tax=Amphiura filiformis TaxID=82378 RepID=UPI003B225721